MVLKKLSLILLILGCFFITGCGKDSSNEVLKDLDKKINDSKGYVMSGFLEVLNNDDIYNYEVKTAYKKDNYYTYYIPDELKSIVKKLLKI